MKKVLLLFLSLFLLNFVSAQYFSNYGAISITDLFDRWGENIIYLTLLVIFSLIISAVLRRSGAFREQSGVIAIGISLLIVYGIYRSGFGVENWLYDLGFSSGSLQPILLIILIIAAVVLALKLGFGFLILIFGLFLVIISIFTDLVYEKATTAIIGAVLALIGFYLFKRALKKKKDKKAMQVHHYFKGNRVGYHSV